MSNRGDPDRGQAQVDWAEAFGAHPPPFLSVAFMRKALSYEAQCKANGGMSPATRRSLKQVTMGKPVTELAMAGKRAGSHLIREWNGRTYQVEVVEGGYRMDGKSWPSLSAIAKHITGTTWSGPRFFGLTARAGQRQ